MDVCDLSGKPTGETVPRRIAHAEGICHRTAHVWLICRGEKGTEVLLQKRSQEKDSYPGFYDTSSAGHIPAGDEPLVSAIRELEEELGVKAGEGDFDYIGSFHIQYEEIFHGKPFRDNEVAQVYVYRGQVSESMLTLQREEIESVKWFPLESVLKAVESSQEEEAEEKFCVPPDSLRLLKKYLGE